MDLNEAVLLSWDRQTRIVAAVASRVDASNSAALPSPDGWPLDLQLAHIQGVRRFWLSKVAPDAEPLPRGSDDGGETAIADLDRLRAMLDESAATIRRETERLLKNPEPVGGYDHPLLFLQHMIWHEGWHVGLIMLGLRLAGQEPPEEWEEAKVWGEWRTE